MSAGATEIRHSTVTRTASLESAIMDLSEAGVATQAIADRLGERFENVRRIEGYMRETSAERIFARETRRASQRHLAAIIASGGRYV